mmetsp:Transcript_24027/g.50093  ORF Transcript_24027/g.50093 Transcript_24027/m.50093 type:complete len:127 (-) Transcript_24027:41-421(-)
MTSIQLVELGDTTIESDPRTRPPSPLTSFFPPSFPSTPPPVRPSLPKLPHTNSDPDEFGLSSPAVPPRPPTLKYKLGCVITCVFLGIFANVSYSLFFDPSAPGGHAMVGLSAGLYGSMVSLLIPIC